MKPQNPKRATYTGIFLRSETKRLKNRHTREMLILLVIKDQFGTTVLTHTWFTLTKEFKSVSPTPGDTIQFDACVENGYLVRPTKIINKK
jgi:hypothetical protein